MNQWNFSDNLLQCTVRIESDLPNNQKSIGTWFFFNFNINDQIVPVIVTNKHVILNSIQGRLKFNICDKDWKIVPKLFQNINISDFQKSWIFHPDDDVDIAIMPTQPLHLQFDTSELKLFRMSFNKELIPNKDQLSNLTAIEDVVMIGYPNWIWDSVNNLPLIRRGITATAVYVDYNDKQEFMIDMACFPGSSWSPVLLYNKGMYQDKNGWTIFGTRIFLLWILYAGPQHTVEGKMEIINIPTTQTTRPISSIPNNLWLVIKAEKLIDFEPILEKILNWTYLN